MCFSIWVIMPVNLDKIWFLLGEDVHLGWSSCSWQGKLVEWLANIDYIAYLIVHYLVQFCLGIPYLIYNFLFSMDCFCIVWDAKFIIFNLYVIHFAQLLYSLALYHFVLLLSAYFSGAMHCTINMHVFSTTILRG